MFNLIQAAGAQGGESQVAFYGFVVVMVVVIALLMKAALAPKSED